MENANIKLQPLWKRLFCFHEYTGGAKTVYDKNGKKKHARICVKCGKRLYID